MLIGAFNPMVSPIHEIRFTSSGRDLAGNTAALSLLRRACHAAKAELFVAVFFSHAVINIDDLADGIGFKSQMYVFVIFWAAVLWPYFGGVVYCGGVCVCGGGVWGLVATEMSRSYIRTRCVCCVGEGLGVWGGGVADLPRSHS